MKEVFYMIIGFVVSTLVVGWFLSNELDKIMGKLRELITLMTTRFDRLETPPFYKNMHLNIHNLPGDSYSMSIDDFNKAIDNLKKSYAAEKTVEYEAEIEKLKKTIEGLTHSKNTTHVYFDNHVYKVKETNVAFNMQDNKRALIINAEDIGLW